MSTEMLRINESADLLLRVSDVSVKYYVKGSEVTALDHISLDAAKASGYSDMQIIFRVIFPEIGPISMAYFVINTPSAIILVTALEFLGVRNVNTVSWGSVHYCAQQHAFFSGDRWWILAPGLIISLFALHLAPIDYAVEEIINPRLRPV